MDLNKFIPVAFLTGLLMVSCMKYSFRGALPSDLKNIVIYDMEDKTGYPGVWEEFMEKLNRAFIADNSLKVIKDEESADLVITGTLVSIQRRPVSINPQEAVQQYQMVLTVKAECRNLHTQTPLWSETLSRYGVISGEALRDEIDQANSVAINQVVEDMLLKTIAAW